MTDLTKAPAIAAAFAALLHRDLEPQEWATMRVRNKTVADGVCASHDFLDANMTMLEAFEVVTGCDSFNMSPDEVELWNAAWEIAKTDYLTERATLDDMAEDFAAYCEREGLGDQGDAEELLHGDLTDDQRGWLSTFVARWDALEAARDLAETVQAHGG